MMAALLLVLALALGTAGALFALRRGSLDPVGGRRLHATETARGGGIGIAAALLIWLLLLHLHDRCSAFLLLGLVCAAGAGLCEDQFGLPIAVRIAAQLLAGLALAAALESSSSTSMGLGAGVFVVLSTVALINLVNFMDGANGLVALQLILFALAAYFFLEPPDLRLLAAILGLSVLSFLPWNFPNARVFLGDVGSYTLGFAIAMLIHAGAAHQGTQVWIWAGFGLSVLLFDAVFTLTWRVLRRRAFWRAHRQHLYQWLVRVGYSHTKVSAAYACAAALVWIFAMRSDLTEMIVIWFSLAITWCCARYGLLQQIRRGDS